MMQMLLYIDPGTGGMLFTIVFGLIGTVIYAIRSIKIKFKFLTFGKHHKNNAEEKEDFVFFSDHKRYWSIFEPILDEMERRGIRACYMTMSEDDPGLEKKYEHITSKFIGNGNKAFSVMNLLDARIVISTTPGLDVFQWKRSKYVDAYVHILHAPADISMYRMFGIDFYDVIMLSGKYQMDQVRELERLRSLPAKELVICGLPYMDILKERADSSSKKSSDESKITVLVAPSWGASSLLNKFGTDLIDALLETGYNIILRPHPQSYTSEPEMIERIRARYADIPELEWNRDNDNFDVLNRADILISDFSGVMFEYVLIFDRPLIYADVSYDKSPYDCCWIKDDLWTFKVLPKIGKCLDRSDIPRIKDMIDESINDLSYREARSEARSQTWEYIGEGTARTVDFLMSMVSC